MVSIKDVAKLAGVSTATVSRTLAEPAKVAESTRDKVMAAVQASGYVANSLARNFRRRKTHSIVVLVPDITNTFFAGVIQGIEWVAHREGYQVLLGDTQFNPEGEKAYAAMVSQRQADGVISLGGNIPFKDQHGCSTVDSSWPPFAMACEYEGVTPVPTVCIDNVSAAFDAVSHLTTLGHTKVAFINGPTSSSLCKDRLQGYQLAMKKAGVSNTRAWVVEGDFSLSSGRDKMMALLLRDEKPTAVFTANDEMAIGAMTSIKAMGFKIPADISVVGFDDIRFAEFTDPPLTTINQPTQEIGKRVVSLMFDMLDGKAVAQQRIELPHRLVKRASTQALRADI